jgi:hypothetical protein
MRNFLLLSIGGAVVVGSIALYMLFGDSGTTAVETETAVPVSEVEDEAKPVSTPIAGTDTLQSLLELGENLECTITYQIEGEADMTTEGTYFTSRGRMRGDFLVESMGTTALSSMILSEDTMYSWTEIEGGKYGMKMTLSEFEATQTDETTPDAQEAVPFDAQVKYTCKPWVNIDGSIFEPPTDIIFTDYSAAMNTGMEFGTVYEGAAGVNVEQQCAMCSELEGAAAAQCRTMLACE